MRWLGLALIALLVACSLHTAAPELPVDYVDVHVAPGQFGWIKADKDAYGQLGRDITVIVAVRGPVRLAEVGCVIYVGGARLVAFVPNKQQTWTLIFRALPGEHHLRVEVGDVVREETLRVWIEQVGL